MSRSSRRGLHIRSTPSNSRILALKAAVAWSNRTVRVGGVPAARTWSSRPHRASAAHPGTCTWWVDRVSLGNVARSTASTFSPRLASSMAVAAPATRVPTMITSYIAVSSPVMVLPPSRRRLLTTGREIAARNR